MAKRRWLVDCICSLNPPHEGGNNPHAIIREALVDVVGLVPPDRPQSEADAWEERQVQDARTGAAVADFLARAPAAGVPLIDAVVHRSDEWYSRWVPWPVHFEMIGGSRVLELTFKRDAVRVLSRPETGYLIWSDADDAVYVTSDGHVLLRTTRYGRPSDGPPEPLKSAPAVDRIQVFAAYEGQDSQERWLRRTGVGLLPFHRSHDRTVPGRGVEAATLRATTEWFTARLSERLRSGPVTSRG
jgi:hypothetical protein